MKCRAPLILALLLLPAAASAQDGPTGIRAREYFATGTSHFEAGRYLDAQAAFAAGFELSHKPGFLWNMAECARLLGSDARALELYERFLAEAPQDAPRRREAEQRVQELAPRPIAKAPPPEPLVPRVAPVAPRAEESSPPADATPRDGPLYTRWWFWTGAGAVVAAAAVVTVVAVANSGSGARAGAGGNGAHTIDWRSWVAR